MRKSPLAFLLAVALLPLSGLDAAAPPGKETANAPSPLPPAPQGRILDTARAFTFQPDVHEQLSARLSETSSLHNLDIYVAAYSFLLDETIESRARRLADKWLSHPRGLVIVYVRGGSRITFAAAEGSESFLPSSELEEMFTIAAMSAREFDDPALRLQSATEQLIHSIVERFEAQEDQRSLLRRDTLLLALGVGVLVFLISRLGLILLRVDRRPGSARFFPTVRVFDRFGAPHGGGPPVEVSFASPPPDSTDPPSEPLA